MEDICFYFNYIGHQSMSLKSEYRLTDDWRKYLVIAIKHTGILQGTISMAG